MALTLWLPPPRKKKWGKVKKMPPWEKMKKISLKFSDIKSNSSWIRNLIHNLKNWIQDPDSAALSLIGHFPDGKLQGEKLFFFCVKILY